MPGKIGSLYKLKKRDADKAAEILADAFQHDPIWKTIFKDAPDIREAFKIFFRFPVKYCMRYGNLYATSENMEGLAGWTAGKDANMSTRRMLLSGTFTDMMKMDFKTWMNMVLVYRNMDDDRKLLMKGKEFIYLIFLMVVGVVLRY